MSTELPQQIKNINHEVKYKYGDIYAEQVNEVINDVPNLFKLLSLNNSLA